MVPESSRPWLLALAIFGLLVPNGIFVYCALTQPQSLWAALATPISAVFLAEAFALTFFFAWLLRREGKSAPGWRGFLLLSFVGSLLFSVPLTLYLHTRGAER
jgi:hypothetical protein